MTWFRKAAEQGHPGAQGNLGIAYLSGQGVQRNYTEALNWLRKAADQNDAQAQANLASMYANGQGIAKNSAEAFRWYRKAAEQGVAGAQYIVAMDYANGVGVAKNETEAVNWFRKAADQGMAEAQANLADSVRGWPGHHQGYFRSGPMGQQGRAAGDFAGPGKPARIGRGRLRARAKRARTHLRKRLGQPQDRRRSGDLVPSRGGTRFGRRAVQPRPDVRRGRGIRQSDVEAYKWFSLAAAQGHADARKQMAEVAKRLTAEQIAQAKETAKQTSR